MKKSANNKTKKILKIATSSFFATSTITSVAIASSCAASFNNGKIIKIPEDKNWPIDAIPQENLNIFYSIATDTYLLNGLTSKPIDSKYTKLYIPWYISEITNRAFLAEFVATETTSTNSFPVPYPIKNAQVDELIFSSADYAKCEIINSQAFALCNAFTKITINAKRIDDSAFLRCESIKTIDCLSRTESFGERVFTDCHLVSEMTISTDSMPAYGPFMFSSQLGPSPKLTLYVKSNLVSVFQNDLNSGRYWNYPKWNYVGWGGVQDSGTGSGLSYFSSITAI